MILDLLLIDAMLLYICRRLLCILKSIFVIYLFQYWYSDYLNNSNILFERCTVYFNPYKEINILSATMIQYYETNYLINCCF